MSIAKYAQNANFGTAVTTAATITYNNLNGMIGTGLDFKACMVNNVASKKRILQAVQPTKPVTPTVLPYKTVTHEDWVWWRKNKNLALSANASPSKTCLASDGAQNLINNYVIGNKSENFNYFNGLIAAYDRLYSLLGDKASQRRYGKFKGKKVKGSLKNYYKKMNKNGKKAKVNIKLKAPV